MGKTPIGEAIKVEVQEIMANRITGNEISGRTRQTKIRTDQRIIPIIAIVEMEITLIQLEIISGHQTDPKITIGAVKIGITTTGMGKMEIIRDTAQITMAGMAKAGSIVGTATVRMKIIITGMEDIIKIPRIKIFNKKEVVETTDIPRVDQIDDKWDPTIIQKTNKEGVR